MKTYFNAGPVGSCTLRSIISEVIPSKDEKQVFNHCIEKMLSDGKIYLLIPLSEVSRIYEIPSEAFLSDEMLDVINKLSKKCGYSKLVTIDEP